MHRGIQSALLIVIGVKTCVVRASLGQDIGKHFATADTWRQSFVCCRLVTSHVFLAMATGCGMIRVPFAAPQGSHVLDNPLFVPALDREFIWNQSVDAVDDYFRIEREDRVRLIGGVLTEGRIDTHQQTGSTLLEPWRKDSASPYEKLHATLQSLRRKCAVRVIPTEGGYLIDVQVLKELEDLDKPENATVGGATLRSDGSLVRDRKSTRLNSSHSS